MGGTVYLDRTDAELRLDGGALAVYVKGERDGMVPLTPVDRIVVIGRQTVETALLHRLAEQGIAVLFLSGRTHSFRGRLAGRLHNHARLRLAQYQVHRSPMALALAREWVTAKLDGQASLLTEAADVRPDRRAGLLHAASVIKETRAKAADAETLGRLRGLEGGAAAAYFAALPSLFPPSLGFEGRERRPPRDPVNALLSLTYTLAHWEWVRECELIGLDPLIGFFHEIDYGRESLACDLLEPFRPLVDRWVWTLFRDRQFDAQDFASEQDRPGCSLKKAARSRYYQAYEQWMTQHRPRLRETVEALARRVMNDGSDPLS
ncbi:MAG: CRISPR-associated endonuclease Cas1 [Nitrospira sp.]|nr:CRISPR-associated endonuclease Cas1 [Nitrospira sp.]MCP9475910.1 CRISPR-associated endonuclease Cas1 [Nitrospira sp.]